MKTGLELVDRNLSLLVSHLSQLYPGVFAKEQTVSLATGDNSIVPSVPNPRGRFVVFQSAAANLFDKGMVGSAWVINASAPCTVKLAFF